MTRQNLGCLFGCVPAQSVSNRYDDLICEISASAEHGPRAGRLVTRVHATLAYDDSRAGQSDRAVVCLALAVPEFVLRLSIRFQSLQRSDTVTATCQCDMLDLVGSTQQQQHIWNKVKACELHSGACIPVL